ncbi:MAG TPA: FAD-dependent oxidoreductase [Polyangiales bacterium]|nr:FAD-dependent oxidoreductase [Polyangiales bacterium]
MPALPAEIELDFGLDEPQDPEALRARAARALSVPEAELPAVVLRKRSVDARRGSVRFHVLLEVGGSEPSELGLPHPRQVGEPRAIIVGDGPAGLFCAYELARHGVGSIVLDRGKPVQPRRHDLKGLNRHGVVDPDSNYCFGEGGAGTYSDGKLYTRAHKRGNVRDVIEILARHGAPVEILTDARPHIGSNRLPQVVSSLRRELEQVGVKFRFGARVTELLRGPAGVRGVRLADGGEIEAACVVLATGHSAADVYAMLAEQGVQLEAKSFALGVRIEHPQPLINRIQYGAAATHPALPTASYRLAHTVGARGVFSFCMCPGGFIVPASTEPETLVVNGMSLARRSSRFANSGLVVGVEPEDVARAGFTGVTGGLALQRRIEQAAFAAGGGGLRAPGTRVTDFVAGRGSSTLPASSYLPGVVGGDIAAVLDCAGIEFSRRLREALIAFDKKLRGYMTAEAALIGVESRTSSPVRVVRDAETLQAPGVQGLYPTGEGAGYAGGIMSAAMDGMRVARMIVAGS